MKTMSKRFKTLLSAGSILVFSLLAISHASAQICVPPPSGLVSWWPADGNADDIADENDGTLQNGTTFGPGIVGTAFSFDGIDDVVALPPSNTLYNPVTGFTWEAWVNPSQLTEGTIMGAGDPALCEDFTLGIGEFSELGIPPDHVWAIVDAVGECGARTRFSGPVPGGTQTGTYYHLALTVDYPNNAAHLYVNGEPIAQTNLSGPVNARDMVVSIGAFRHEENSIFRGAFHGLIDEVAVYNRTLSAAEIQDIFNAGSAGKCKEPDTVIIDGCDTGVPNTLLPSGSTISDLIADCAEGASNHGQFVSCLSHLTNDLRKDGTVTGQQKGALQSCAAQAGIP